MVHRLSCSVARGIYPDQGLNLHLLHWREDSLPLSHQGSPQPDFISKKVLWYDSTAKRQITKLKKGQSTWIDISLRCTTDSWKDAQKSLVIREVQIKSTIRYHFVSVRMSIIKKIRHSKCWHGYGEKGTLVCCWWDCKLAQTLGKIIWRFFKKLKTIVWSSSST